MRRSRWPTSLAFLAMGLSPALAQPVTPAPVSPLASPAPATPAAAADAAKDAGPKFSASGYLESYYGYNFNTPSNGITNARAYDNRHDSFTLQNAQVEASVTAGSLSGRLGVQFGSLGAAYYLAEPTLGGTSTTAVNTGDLWKYVQQANVSWVAPIGRGLTLSAGIFMAPIGPENLPVKDNWNWSLSFASLVLPNYQTGLSLTYPVTDALSISLGVFNGWDSVVDGNSDKSVTLTIAHKVEGKHSLQFLYAGGNERRSGAPEGRPWRHLFDLFAIVDLTPWFSFYVHGDAGFEQHRFGTTTWAAGAISMRFRVKPWLYVAVRGDVFWEDIAKDAAGQPAPVVLPSSTMGAGTLTLDFRPHPNFSIRPEYRHDRGNANAFFSNQVAGAGTAESPYVPNAKTQDTLTLGIVGWF